MEDFHRGGGTISSAISALKQHGACDQNFTLERLKINTAISYLGLLYDFRNALVAERLGNSTQTDDQILAETRQAIGHFYQSHKREKEFEVLPSSVDLWSTIMNTSPLELSSKVVATLCSTQHSVPLSLPQFNEYDVRQAKAPGLTIGIDERIACIQSQPLGATFCDNVISDPNYVGISENGSLKSDCRRHTAIIAGKRTVSSDHTQELLIRNSWGKDCGGIKNRECDGRGNFWIPTSQLANNLLTLSEFSETNSN